MPDGRPRVPFIADAVEASLALGWYVLFVVGMILGTLVSPIFFAVVVVGVVGDWLMLRHRVARRLGLARNKRRVLWQWTSYRGVYHAVRYLAGRE